MLDFVGDGLDGAGALPSGVFGEAVGGLFGAFEVRDAAVGGVVVDSVWRRWRRRGRSRPGCVRVVWHGRFRWSPGSPFTGSRCGHEGEEPVVDVRHFWQLPPGSQLAGSGEDDVHAAASASVFKLVDGLVQVADGGVDFALADAGERKVPQHGSRATLVDLAAVRPWPPGTGGRGDAGRGRGSRSRPGARTGLGR